MGLGHPALAVVFFDSLEQIVNLLYPGSQFVIFVAARCIQLILRRAHGIDFFQ